MPWRTPKKHIDKNLKPRKRSIIAERFHKTMEAITFAEAGETETAREILRNYEREVPKVLVVSDGKGFSSAVTEYALGFVERMNYEIVALIITFSQ